MSIFSKGTGNVALDIADRLQDQMIRAYEAGNTKTAEQYAAHVRALDDIAVTMLAAREES